MAKNNYPTETEEKDEETPNGKMHGDINFTTLVRQIKKERDFSKKSLDSKKQLWRLRLKLYNNQKRDPEAVGDPLMFTVMQTVLASLYEDELSAGFEPNSEGDYEIAKNVEQMADFDRSKMELDELEWDWDWDSCFFGRGFMLQQEFDRTLQVPVSEVIDPLTIERDPKAKSVNGKGLKRKGAARFIGRELFVTESEVTEEAGFFNTELLCNSASDEEMSQAEQDRRARDEAQGRDPQLSHTDLGDNTEYLVYQWFTHWKVRETVTGVNPDTDEEEEYERLAVRKVEVWLTGDMENVIRFEVLKDAKGSPAVDWPISDRPLYPTAHDWDGVSIPDLTEDKQRARAAILNLTLQGLKADLYPMYIYDKNKITNRNDLNFGFNKMVGVDGDINNKIAPINKAQPRMDIVNYILDTLDQSAQRATATPEVQQGQVSSQQRTLGELNLVAAKVDTRYTLSMKVWGWSAKRYWRRWFQQYMENMADEIDEKIVRVSGALGSTIRKFSKKEIMPQEEFDITIESKVVSDSKRAMKLQNFTQFVQSYAQTGILNLPYQARKHAELAGFAKDEIEMLLPPSVEEMVAEGENSLLSENKGVAIAETDNHQVHLMVHARAKQTKQLMAHILAHKKAMTLPRDQMIASGGTIGGTTPAPISPGQPGAPGSTPPVAGGAPGSVPMPPTSSEMASGGGAGSTPGGQQAVIPSAA